MELLSVVEKMTRKAGGDSKRLDEAYGGLQRIQPTTPEEVANWLRQAMLLAFGLGRIDDVRRYVKTWRARAPQHTAQFEKQLDLHREKLSRAFAAADQPNTESPRKIESPGGKSESPESAGVWVRPTNCGWEVTVVSGYFDIPNKLGGRGPYDRFMENFLRLPCAMCLFADAPSADRFRTLRQQYGLLDRTWIYRCTLADFETHKRMDFWKACQAIDQETAGEHHNPHLYMVWNEKSFLVEKAIRHNPFGSEYFFWADVGSCRDPNEMPQIMSFPHPETVRRVVKADKFVLSCVHDISPTDRTLNSHGFPALVANKADGSACDNFVRIQGGFLGGHRKMWPEWLRVFRAALDKFERHRVFAGKDQNVMTALAIWHPELFQIVHPRNLCGPRDPWYYFRHWLAADPASTPAKPTTTKSGWMPKRIICAGWLHDRNAEGLEKGCKLKGIKLERVADVAAARKALESTVAAGGSIDDHVVWLTNSYVEPNDGIFARVRLLYGPHNFVLPEGPLAANGGSAGGGGGGGDVGRFPNARFLCPSEWVRDGYLECGGLIAPMICSPFGLDTDQFAPAGARGDDILVYFKYRSEADLHAVLTEVGRLNKSREKPREVRVFRYGSYARDEYRNALRQCAYGIWIGGHESQGFALQEALSSGVPLLVWTAHSMYDELDKLGRPVFEEHKKKGLKLAATTVPYWDDRCGSIVHDLDGLAATLPKFDETFRRFDPRAYVLQHLSIPAAIQKLAALLAPLQPANAAKSIATAPAVDERPLLSYGRSVFSQCGEDGVTAEIVRRIGLRGGVCMEFGAADGVWLSNTRRLILEEGWNGIFAEADVEKYLQLRENYRTYGARIHCVHAAVAESGPSSIDAIIDESPFDHVDFLSIDVDGLDFDLFRGIKKHFPSFLCIEVNARMDPDYPHYVPPEIAQDNVGQSMAVICKHAATMGPGYTPVAYTGNLFLVRNDHARLFPTFSLRELYVQFFKGLDAMNRQHHTDFFRDHDFIIPAPFVRKLFKP